MCCWQQLLKMLQLQQAAAILTPSLHVQGNVHKTAALYLSSLSACTRLQCNP
jgi:hypothetical protein